jgi:thymidylate synthase ThyX
MHLKSLGCPPDVARNVLPIGVKTEFAITQTMHWWREFFKLRTTKHVHPDMLYLSRPLLGHFKEKYPELFNDISYGD